jgi:hypothetical protein
MNDEQNQALLDFFRAVGQPERIKILGLVANRAYNIAELATALEMPESEVIHHLRKLRRAGLVHNAARVFGLADAFGLNQETLHRLQAVVEEGTTPRPWREIVLERYVRAGRLKSVPAHPDERQVILEWLAEQFEAGKRYSEASVNSIIAQHYPKQEMLRRYLVDRGLLKRLGDIYWRGAAS